MLNEGTTDYPFTLSRKGFNNDNNHDNNNDDDNNQLIQKWVGMVDRCLEQQWKDSQQLLDCAKALKNSSNHSQWNLDMIVKELSYLELGIIQRFIDLRQELVHHAYPIELFDEKKNAHAADNVGVTISCSPRKKNLGGQQSSSFYMSLPSSPESDIYEPLLSKVNTLKNTTPSNDYDHNDDDALDNDTIDDNDKRCSGSITGDSPFTLHSKLWQHHRLQQKQPDSLSSSSSSSSTSSILVSSPRHLRPFLAPSSSAPVIHDLSQQEDLDTSATKKTNRCSPNFIPACTYNYYPPSNNNVQQGDDEEPADLQQLCQQCFFCRSSMPRQKSLSLNERARSVGSSDRYSSPSSSPSSSFICSRQQDHTAATIQHQDEEDIHAHQLPSPPPSIPLPIRTSSSLDTAAATPFMISTTSDAVPQATISTPALGANTLASHITPSIPSSSSSMVHTMSTRFHFKRNTEGSKKKILSSTTTAATAFSHHCTASAITSNSNNSNSNSDQGKSSSRFVRSLMHRKVSFPTLFSSNNRKVHPVTTTTAAAATSNDDNQSMGSSFLL